jgi:hypothetical protein
VIALKDVSSMSQEELFTVEVQRAILSKLGDPLEKLNAAIDWNVFYPTLKHAFKKA